MEFTFDLSQTPVIGRRQRPSLSHHAVSSSTASSVYGSYSVASTATLTSAMAASVSENSDKDSIGRGTITGSTISNRNAADDVNSTLSPKRSLSLTNADSSAFSGWKRPWMSQVFFLKMDVYIPFISKISIFVVRLQGNMIKKSRLSYENVLLFF